MRKAWELEYHSSEVSPNTHNSMINKPTPNDI